MRNLYQHLSEKSAMLFVATAALLASSPMALADTPCLQATPLTNVSEEAFQMSSIVKMDANGNVISRNFTSSTMDQSQMVADKATRADDAQYEVSFKILKPSEENIVPTVMILIGQDGYGKMWYWLEEGTEFDTTLSNGGTLPNGNYYALGVANKKDGDTVLCNLYYCSEVTINGEAVIVDIDFDQCTHKLALGADMGNGEPFPTNLDAVWGDVKAVATTAMFKIGMDGGDQKKAGTTNVYAMVNDAPAAASYSVNIGYRDWANMSGSTAFFGVSGPFRHDLNGWMPQNMYMHATNKSSLTEKDLAFGMRNMVYGEVSLSHDADGSSTFFTGTTYYTDSENPVCEDEMEYYLTVAPSHVKGNSAWENGMFTGFLVQDLDPMRFSRTVKGSGPQMLIDNKLIITPWQSGKVDGVATLVSPVDIFNINPEEQEIVNFLHPLFGDPAFQLNLGEDNTIAFCSVMGAKFIGPFYEAIQLPFFGTAFPNYTKLYMDGKEVSFNDVSNVPIEGFKIEGEQFYNDGLVDGKYPCRYSTKFSMSTANPEDYQIPAISAYQVRNGEGKITGHISLDDKDAMFYCGGRDQTHYVEGQPRKENEPTVEVYLAKGGESTDWMLIETKQEYVGGNTGKFCSFNISEANLEPNSWYAAKIKVIDPSNNTVEAILPYCFELGDSTGVEAMTGTEITSVEYFTPAGVRVANPENGLFIRVSKMADGSVKSEKVMMR